MVVANPKGEPQNRPHVAPKVQQYMGMTYFGKSGVKLIAFGIHQFKNDAEQSLRGTRDATVSKVGRTK